MDRRTAIRNILIAAAATLVLPGCSRTKVGSLITDGQLLLDQAHKDYLSKISQSLLPIQGLSDKVENPLDFIMTMLNDTFAPEKINLFADGFQNFKALIEEGKLQLNAAGLEEALPLVKNALEGEKLDEALIFFINTTKDLSVRNLISSEFYMTEYLNYTLVPGPVFKGCENV